MHTHQQQQAQQQDWRVVEVQIRVHAVNRDGERRTTREVLDGNGRRWGRWEEPQPARPPLSWD